MTDTTELIDTHTGKARAHWLSIRIAELYETIVETNESFDEVIAGLRAKMDSVNEQRRAALAHLEAEHQHRVEELEAWHTAQMRDGGPPTQHLAGATIKTRTPRKPAPVWRDEQAAVEFLLAQGADTHVRTKHYLDKTAMKAAVLESVDAKLMTGPGDYAENVIPGVDLEWKTPTTTITPAEKAPTE